MKWKHNFKHLDVSDALKTYVEDSFGKLEHFLLKDSHWQVFYSKSKHHHECQVDIHVQNGNGHFKAKAKQDSFYAAVDEAAEKLSKQFQKKKEKLQHHKSPARSKEGRIERLNERLEYDNSPFPAKKPA